MIMSLILVDKLKCLVVQINIIPLSNHRTTLCPGSAWRLARRVKSAAGGNQANKLIQAAALMGAPSCTWQEAPAWAAPQQALH